MITRGVASMSRYEQRGDELRAGRWSKSGIVSSSEKFFSFITPLFHFTSTVILTILSCHLSMSFLLTCVDCSD
jgi:hypothetical protein